MQGARGNTGRVSVNLGGKHATRLSSTPQAQPAPFKPAEFGAPAPPGSGPKTPPPPSSVPRPVPATAAVPRSGSREIARVGSAALIEAGRETGSPAEPAQHAKPAG